MNRFYQSITFMMMGLMFPILLAAQEEKVISQPLDSASFDFWVGDWELTWKNADGSTGKGTNHVLRIMGEKVIQENFEATGAGPLKGYKGMSVSVFNAATKTWNQTWVDNQGGYLDFTGESIGDKRIFKRSFVGPKGKTVHQRMVFYDITSTSMNWDWENSLDEGKTWKLQWQIAYKRK